MVFLELSILNRNLGVLSLRSSLLRVISYQTTITIIKSLKLLRRKEIYHQIQEFP